MNPFITPSTMNQLYVAASVSMLVYYNSIRRRHYVTRSGISSTTASPWHHQYENGDEVSFLNLTGFSCLEKHLKKCINIYMNVMVRAVQDYSILAMNLDSSSFILVQWSIQNYVSFSDAHQLVTVYIHTFLTRKLRNRPKAQIHWPNTLVEKEVLADLVNRREPQVDDVIGFTDGISFPIHRIRSDQSSYQLQWLSPWHHDQQRILLRSDLESCWKHWRLQNFWSRISKIW